MLDKLLAPLLRRTRRIEESLVREPDFARRLLVRDALLFVAVLVAMWHDDEGSLLSIAATLLVAVFVGWGALSGSRRAMSYRSGWLDGRRAMVSTLSESMRRQMTLEEWLDAELSRDLAVMGIDPHRSSDTSDE